MNNQEICPRCGAMALKNWKQLTTDEKEVVRRLPAAAESETEQRLQLHRWCTRCWYEIHDNETNA